MKTLSPWTEEKRSKSVQIILYGKNKPYVTDHEL